MRGSDFGGGEGFGGDTAGNVSDMGAELVTRALLFLM